MPAVAIAKTFLSALAHLSSREQGLTWDFVGKFLEDHVRNGTRLERVTRAKVPHLWSARVSQDLRAILHQEGETYLMLYVDHHDASYAWAERRQMHHDQKSDRLQIIEIQERAVEIEVSRTVYVAPPLFEAHGDTYLRSLGVPEEWLPALRSIRDHDQLLSFALTLPEEVAEALLDVANGEVVTPPAPSPAPSVFHADAGRRYHIVSDQDELSRALEGPLEDWMLFLHPDQRQLVEGIFSGPAFVIGAAGTGKTVVAVHRARELARRGARVLLATFTRALADNLSHALARLCSPSERALVEVSTVHRQGLRLAGTTRPDLKPLTDEQMLAFLRQARDALQSSVPIDLLQSELRGVIAPAGITEWEGYRDASRVGRGALLHVIERRDIWSVVAKARGLAWQSGQLDWAGICGVASRALRDHKASSLFQAVLVDEVQDLGMAELRLIHALAEAAPGNFMAFGDAAQRIYAGRASLEAAGIDITGRMFSLRTNYRTTDSIHRAAEATLEELPGEVRTSRSLLRGPVPVFRAASTAAEERTFVGQQVERWVALGIHSEEIAILSRVEDRLEIFRDTLAAEGIITSGLLGGAPGAVRIGTLHSAKGLEFKAVAIVGCDDDTLPNHYAVMGHRDPL